MRDIRYDFTTNTIIVAKAFLEAASIPDSEEYKQLQRIISQNPTACVVPRTIKHRKAENPTKGLTYKYMRKFIKTLDEANLSVFNETIMYYEDKYEDSATVYKHVRNWFLDNYPYHNEMIVDNAPQRKVNIKPITGGSSRPDAA